MAKKQPARGRPPKKPGETLDTTLLVLLKSSEKADYKAKAEAAGMSVNSWIRDRLNRQRK